MNISDILIYPDIITKSSSITGLPPLIRLAHHTHPIFHDGINTHVAAKYLISQLPIIHNLYCIFRKTTEMQSSNTPLMTIQECLKSTILQTYAFIVTHNINGGLTLRTHLTR